MKSSNSNDVSGVLQQFAKDGIRVLQDSPTRKGTEAGKEFFIAILRRLILAPNLVSRKCLVNEHLSGQQHDATIILQILVKVPTKFYT